LYQSCHFGTKKNSPVPQAAGKKQAIMAVPAQQNKLEAK
jgi:hypothetical protein